MGSVCGGTCGLPASRGEIVERDLRNSLQLAFRTLIRTTVCGLRARPGTLFFEHEAQIERAGCVTSPISPTICRGRGMAPLTRSAVGCHRPRPVALLLEQHTEAKEGGGIFDLVSITVPRLRHGLAVPVVPRVHGGRSPRRTCRWFPTPPPMDS